LNRDSHHLKGGKGRSIFVREIRESRSPSKQIEERNFYQEDASARPIPLATLGRLAREKEGVDLVYEEIGGKWDEKALKHRGGEEGRFSREGSSLLLLERNKRRKSRKVAS